MDEEEITLESDPIELIILEEPDEYIFEVDQFMGQPGREGDPGPKGDKGDPGDGSGPVVPLNQEFEIPVASTLWVVEHTLPFKPTVTLFDSFNRVFHAEITYDPALPIITIGPMNSAESGRVNLS